MVYAPISIWNNRLFLSDGKNARRYHEIPKSMWMRYLSCDGIYIYLWKAPKSNTFIFAFLVSKSVGSRVWNTYTAKFRGSFRTRNWQYFDKRQSGRKVHKYIPKKHGHFKSILIGPIELYSSKVYQTVSIFRL